MAEIARAPSVRRFGLAYAGWLVTWILDAVLRWPITLAMVLRQFPAAADFAGTLLIGETVVMVAIAALVGWLAWRSPSPVARWLAIVLLVLAALFRLLGLASLRLDLMSAIWVLGLVAIAAALWFQFQPDARAWYERPAPPDEGDDGDEGAAA